MADKPVRPRNFAAMREDRVRAMASAHFGREFNSKGEAIDALTMLSPEQQRSLAKPGASKSAVRKSPSKFSNELRGGVAVPTSDKLAAARAEVVQRYARATTGLATKSKAQALTLMAKFGPTDVAKASGAALQKTKAAAMAAKPVTDAQRLAAGMSAGRNVHFVTPPSPVKAASNRMIAGMSSKGRLGGIVALTLAVGSVIADAMGTEAMASEKKKPSGPSSNTVKVKQAEAQAKQADAAAKEAEAKAKEAEARTRQIEAETEAKRLSAGEKERADKMAADQAERTFGTAVSTGAYATGVVAGMVVAKGLDKKFSAGLKAKNEALELIARDVTRILDKKSTLNTRDGHKLRAIVATADKTRLTKVGRGAAGPTFGVGLITLGLTSRTLASQQENETVATIMNATGSAEMVAGATVLVKDLANRASSPDLVNVRALSKVEQARAVAKTAPLAEEAGSVLSKVSKVAGKLALPVAVAGAAIVAMRSSAQAGENVTEIAASGLTAGADIVTSGAVSEFNASKAAGEGTGAAVARGVIAGATMGVVPMIDSAIKESGQGGLVDYMTNLYRQGAESANAYLNDGAKQKAEAVPPPAPTPAHLAPLQIPKSDGRTESYTRVVNGKTVQVAAYSTPKK